MDIKSAQNLPIFIITVDTEADDAWVLPEKIEVKNLIELRRFQDLCQTYGIIPTFLVTYECAKLEEAISVLKPIADSGQCEIGHHLHCWTTPPFVKEGPPGVDIAWFGAYQSELPESLFREKAECLRNEIVKAYGIYPTSHRAGRWGIDQRSVDWLIENGFVAESSVTPLINWATSIGKKTGGPSFYSSPQNPYFWHSKLIYDQHAPFLVEIPITVEYPDGFALRGLAGYIKRELPGTKFVDRIYKKLGCGRIFRPDPRYSENIMLGIMENAIKNRMFAINLMIHSSELSVGLSPFSKTKDLCAQVWQKLKVIFKHVKKLGLQSTTLSEAAIIYRDKHYYSIRR